MISNATLIYHLDKKKRINKFLPSDLISCEYDDCRPGYWGNDCQYGPLSKPTSNQCSISFGLSGTGKCTCDGKTDIQEHCRPGTSPGFILSKYDTSFDNLVSTQTISSLDSYDFSKSDPYQRYIITGKIYITKTGTHYFKATANSHVQITINGQTSNSNDFYECSTSEVTTQLSIYLYADNIYSIQIIYNTGCSMNKPSLKLHYQVPGGSFAEILVKIKK